MRSERWFRGERGDQDAAFDWSRAARDFDVPLEAARALYLRALRLEADLQRAEALYLRWLREAAAAVRRPAAPAPAPGRRTLAARETCRPGVLRPPADAAQAGLGKWTRVLLEAEADADPLPGRDDVQRAMQSLAGARQAPALAGHAARARGTAASAAETSTVPDAAFVPSRRAQTLAVFGGHSTTNGRSPGAAPADPGAAEAVREQLIAAVASGHGTAEVLAAANPEIAAEALRGLRHAYVPGRSAPVLRLVTEASGGEALRALARGSASAGVPAGDAARLGRHIGAEAAGAARLHTDAAADVIAAAHHARALTRGVDIFFARGEYAPGTERGDELLAHELTHVAQGQRGELARAAAKGIDSGAPLDAAEAEADLRARLAVVQLHPTDAALPALAAPSGAPASDADRTARIAAQQQRITLADQATPVLPDPQAPSAVTAQAPVANPAPTMTAPTASASTGNAYLDVFQAPPSKQAMSLWAAAGTQATTQAAAEQAKFNAGLPQMPVALVGVPAPAAGGAATPATGGGPGGTAAPTTGGAPPAATAAAAPPQPTADQVAAQTAAALAAVFPFKSTPGAAQDQSQAQAQAQTDGQQAIDSLPTTAPSVNTDPGAAPMTDLAGQNDPVRTLGVHQQQIDAAATGFEGARNRIATGPGAAQVQPQKLDDKLAVPPPQVAAAMPALPAVDGMTKFAGWNLPASVQASFDTAAVPKMDASLAQARTQMTQAGIQRDADRAKAIADTDDKVAKAHIDADKQQQTKVAESRTRIANYQADALVDHHKQVKQLDQTSTDKRTAAIGKVNDRITTDQAKVDADYKDAQKRATDRKTQGEADAAQKKKDAQDKAANQNWWDQLCGAISSAIQAIADDITKVLTDIGTAIGQILDDVKTAACQVIDAARDFVCQALDEFGTWLKSEVDALIGSVFPGLAAALDQLIDTEVNAAKAAVNTVADGLKQGVTALCDGLKAGLDAAIATFKAAVQAAATLAQALVTGDWGTVAKLVIDGILASLGIDPAAFYALIGTAKDSLDQIVANPGAFVGHLVDAVKLGFKQFGDNFWTHLKDGLVQWLFGTFAQAGIQMPATFDVAGIFDLVCQILGLTWPRLRVKVVGLIGEKNTERIEKVAGYLEALVTGGFAGLWAKVQQDLGNLWTTVTGGIRDWLITNVVQAAVIKLATMWNPVGAIFELIQTAWNAYQWLRENAQRIFGLVEAVVTSISNIVAGNISGAANFIEASLAKLVPIAISLFADLIGLGGIADQIKAIIEQVQTTVDQAIDALIERVMALFGGDEGDGDGDKGDGEIGARIAFEVDGETHTQYIDDSSGTPVAMVASTPQSAKDKIAGWRTQVAKLPEDEQSSVGALIDTAAGLDEEVDALAAATTPGQANPDLEAKQRELATALEAAWTAVFPGAAEFVKTYGFGDPIAAVNVVRLATVNQHAVQGKLPFEGNDKGPGYVVNIAAVAAEVGRAQSIVTRYADAAWAGSTARWTAERTAVVVGVNTFERLDAATDDAKKAEVDAAVSALPTDARLTSAAFGFAWTPKWSNKKTGQDVDIASVRAALEQVPEDQRAAAIEKTERPSGETLPYGIFREEVIGSSYTQDAGSALAALGADPVHVLSQDADGDVAAAGGGGVLTQYDAFLSGLAQHPLITIGGYNFDKFNWGPDADPRTVQLTRLANELDRAIRAAIAQIYPAMLYPSEPNMLIKATDATHHDGLFDQPQHQAALASAQQGDPGGRMGGLFGRDTAKGRHVGQNEGRNAMLTIGQVAGDDLTVAYAPQAGITTSPVPGNKNRGLEVTPETLAEASAGTLTRDGETYSDPSRMDPYTGVSTQAQSYADPRTLAREQRKSTPGVTDDDGASLRSIYAPVEGAGQALSSDPTLTADSPEIQAQLDQVDARADLAKQGKPANVAAQAAYDQAREIAKRIIAAMTADELTSIWSQLKPLLDQVKAAADQAKGGAP